MAKKTIKVEELADLLTKDDDLRELLVARLTESLAPIVERMCNRFVEAFSAKLDILVEKSAKELITKHCETQTQKLIALEETNEALRTRLDQAEAGARLNNLLIHGLEESMELTGYGDSKMDQLVPRADREASQAVVALCNMRLGLTISEADISTAYRIPRRGKDRHRPLIVKFVSQRIRNMVYRARTTLKKSSHGNGDSIIYINEHLSFHNAQIYAKARSLIKEKKAVSAWTFGGNVFIRLTEGQDEKPRRMTTLKNIDELLAHIIPESLTAEAAVLC